MDLKTLQEMWSSDSKIIKEQLSDEALKIPQLHNKYYKIYFNERIILKKKKFEYKNLYKLKWEYYSGKISDEDLIKNNWEPFQNKILRQDFPIYLDADEDLVKSLLNISFIEEKVEYLKDILKSIHARGFHIHDAIEFLKFVNGIS